VNLLIHLLNVILVFYAIFHLSRHGEIALVVSLFFGIHPMHVESVAWASELKDLLYTFFFLASYIFYLKYLKELNRKYYVFAVILFLVSLLSKAMAASLPVLLILTDYFMGRKINRKVILEKAPFFILAIAFGVVAVFAQQTSGAISDMEIYSFPKRIIFACYGFVMYVIKLAIPLNLSAFYPYPVKVGEAIPLIYYFYVFCCIFLFAMFIFWLCHTKRFFFGIGFFAITVFLVLQLLPVGGAIMADRYSYIPSIGIFYLAGEGINYLWVKRQKWIAIMIIGVFTILFSVKTHTRCGVWKDEMTLWNDVISQDQTIPFAYFNRGIVYMNEKQYDMGLADYNKAIELNPKYFHAYNNRGVFYKNNKRNNEAINDFNLAIKLKPYNAEIYYNRGLVFMDENKNIEALTDFNKAIELKPDYADVYNDKGTVFFNERRFEDAKINYSKAIELNPLDSRAYYNRGLALYNLGKNEEACADWKHAASKGYKPASEAYIQICK